MWQSVLPAEKPGNLAILWANSHPRSPVVIANQCAHWCGNPFSLQGNLATWQYFGRIRDALRIRPKCYFLLCTTARRTDCHVASLLAMTVGDVLATAGTCPSSACHCEQRSCNRRHLASFCMSLRTSAWGPRRGAPFAGRGAPRERCSPGGLRAAGSMADFGATRGVAIRAPAGKLTKHVALRANSQRLSYSP